METIALKGFKISLGEYTEFLQNIAELGKRRQSSYVCIANVHMFVEAQKDKSFLHVVDNADIVTPDGKPLSIGLNVLYKLKQPRVSGMNLLPDLLQHLCDYKLPVYFYGSTPTVLAKTEIFLKQSFPQLTLAGYYSPPFRDLDSAEEASVVREINRSNPAVVFVALGCPKQEKWMASMKGKVNAVMVGIGGALPVLIGEKKKAPVWVQDYCLEWLYRLVQEPRRLFKRYAVTNSIFLFLFSREFIRVKTAALLKGR